MQQYNSDSGVNILSTTAQLGSRTSLLAVGNRSAIYHGLGAVQLPHGFDSKIGGLLSSFHGILEDNTPTPGIDLSELSSMEPSKPGLRDESFSYACQMNLLAKHNNLSNAKTLQIERPSFIATRISQISKSKPLRRNKLRHQMTMQKSAGCPWPDIVRTKTVNGVQRESNRL